MRVLVRNLILTSASIILGILASGANADVMEKVERARLSRSFGEFVEKHGTIDTQLFMKDSQKSGSKIAQWVNWPNWGNWNDWNNWGNFSRLPQWGNGWNNFLN